MNRKRMLFGVSLLLALFIIIVLIYISGIENVFNNLLLIEPIYLIPIIILYSFGWLFRGVRWREILSVPEQKMSVLMSIKLYLIGNLTNLVIPAKLGDMTKVFAVKKLYNIDYHRGLSSVLIDRYFDFLSILMMGLLLLPFLIGPELPSWIIVVFIVCFVLIMSSLMVLIVLIQKKGDTYMKVFGSWLGGQMSKLRESIISMALNKKKLAVSLMASFMIWTMECLVTYLFAISLGFNVEILVIFFAIILANMTKALPLTPGGIGPYEAAFSAIFISLSGFGMDVAMSIIVIDHLFKNLYTLIMGTLSGWSTGINILTIRGEAVGASETN